MTLLGLYFSQGLSAGTILYVVVFEVLQREKTKRKVPGLVQLVLIVVGFILMIAVEVTRKFHIFYSETRRDFSKPKRILTTSDQHLFVFQFQDTPEELSLVLTTAQILFP